MQENQTCQEQYKASVHDRSNWRQIEKPITPDPPFLKHFPSSEVLPKFFKKGFGAFPPPGRPAIRRRALTQEQQGKGGTDSFPVTRIGDGVLELFFRLSYKSRQNLPL